MTVYTHNLINRVSASIVALVLAGVCLATAMGPAVTAGIA
jgi:hypothetical protein